MTPGQGLLLGAALAVSGCATFGASSEYDLVIANGRVMDPESGLDAVRNMGITGGRIAAISTGALRGRRVLDAANLVVAPGFIDLHAHGQDAVNYALQAADGVTTALELEVGVADVDRFYAERAGHALINFGASVGHVPVRMAVMGDAPAFLPRADGPAAQKEADETQIAAIRRRIRLGLEQGALAVGFGIQYTPAASRWEILEMFREAAAHTASCHVHMRHNGAKEPNSSTHALEEVLAAAAVTGAPLHVVHLHSTSIRLTPRHLQILGEARARGMDVTTEVYPYTAGMTDLSSGVFNEGWREALGIDYKDLQWVATGERLDATTFTRYRAQGGLVAVHSIPPEAVVAALEHPLVMVASDAVFENGKGHPRASSTYARLLGHYAREQKVLSLMEALRKASLMPAQRLERRAPMFRDKGRLRVGADADITVFDPATVIDRATFENAAIAPTGFVHVLVGGVPVLVGGKLQLDVAPGRAARALGHGGSTAYFSKRRLSISSQADSPSPRLISKAIARTRAGSQVASPSPCRRASALNGIRTLRHRPVAAKDAAKKTRSPVARACAFATTSYSPSPRASKEMPR